MIQQFFLLFCYRVLNGFHLPSTGTRSTFSLVLTFKQLWSLLFLCTTSSSSQFNFRVQNTLELSFSLFGSQPPDNIAHEIVYNHTRFELKNIFAFVTANKHNSLTCSDYKQTADTLHYAPNCENFDTKVNVFPTKKERKNERFTS